MATEWQTLYTEAQYKQAVTASFGLGRHDDVPVIRLAGRRYKDVRLRRRQSTTGPRQTVDYRVQVRRAFLQNAPVRWIDILQTTSEDCAVAFLEDLAVALAAHDKREEIASFRCNNVGAGTIRKPAPPKKAKKKKKKAKS